MTDLVIELCRARIEIERLTAELGELRPAVHANKVQAEEIRGLRDELYSVDKAAKALGAERDRLRAALERISQDEFNPDYTNAADWGDDYWRVVNIAREALAGGGADEK